MNKLFFLGLIPLFLSASSPIDEIKKDAATTVNIYGQIFPIDHTCSEIDEMKLVTIMDDILHGEESKLFLLDTCEPYKSIYQIMKEDFEDRSSAIKKDYNEQRLNRMCTLYPSSPLIHFYSYLHFKKKNPNKPNYANNKVVPVDTAIGKYMDLFYHREIVDPLRKTKSEYYRNVYMNGGQELLSSNIDIVYNSVSIDISEYLKKYKTLKEYEDFMVSRIEENKKRKINSKKDYLHLAQYIFEKEYLTSKEDFSFIDRVKEYLYLSHKAGVTIGQVELLSKVKLIDMYIEMNIDYPATLTMIEEDEYIKEKLNKVTKIKEYVKDSNFYYKNAVESFYREKRLYLNNNYELRKNLLINLQKMNLKEPNKVKFNKRLDLINEIDSLKSGEIYSIFK